MKDNKLKPLRSIFIVFILFMAVFTACRSWLERKGVDVDVAIFGNLILLILTVVSYTLLYKSMQSNNIHAFTRVMLVNFIVKFFVILAVVLIYALMTKEVNKGGVLICVVIYFLYTIIEKAALTKLVRKKNNA